MTAIILGIDPGVTGAVAALTTAGEYVGVVDLPIQRDGKLSWVDGGELLAIVGELRAGAVARMAYVERVGARPGQAAGPMFSFGAGLGSILATLSCAGLPTSLVTPAMWKGSLGLCGDKASSLSRARMLFPTAPLARARDDGRAEALLIAHYGVQQLRRMVS